MKNISKWLERQEHLRPRRWAVAVSGGSDSLGLVLCLQGFTRMNGGELHALIVDHRLRPESSKEAEHVARFLQENGVASTVLVWEHERVQGNIMAQARAARYKFMLQACRTHGFSALFLGHHANDQEETVWMRNGGQGMDVCTRREGIWVVRPFLHLSKTEIRTTLQANGWPWIEDPTNTNPRFLRTKARHFLATNPSPFLHPRRPTDATPPHTFWPMGFATAPLETLSPSGLLVLLKAVAGFINLPSPDALEQALQKLRLGKKTTLGGCVLVPKNGTVWIVREPERICETLPCERGIWLWDQRWLVRFPKRLEGTVRALGLQAYDQHARFFPNRSSLMRLVYAGLPAVWRNEILASVPFLNAPSGLDWSATPLGLFKPPTCPPKSFERRTEFLNAQAPLNLEKSAPERLAKAGADRFPPPKPA